jgi:hypothetical protein
MGANKNTIIMTRLTAVLSSWPGEETLPKCTLELREILARHMGLSVDNLYVSGGEISRKGLTTYSFKVEIEKPNKCDKYITLGFFEIYSTESSIEEIHTYWATKVPKWLRI